MSKADGEKAPPEPRGLGEHARGLAAEYAHEQGWGLDEAERTALPHGRQPAFGGTDYEYGARDFGDVPEDAGGTDSKFERQVEKALGGTTQGVGEGRSSSNATKSENKETD